MDYSSYGVFQMMDRLDHAIRAGVIGGIILVVLSILNSGFSITVLGCIFGLLTIITALGTGALASRFAHHHMGGMTEVITLSGIAGAIAGAIDGILQVVPNFIRPGFNSYTIFGFFGKEVTALLCAPGIILIYILMIAVLAMIGGVLYRALVD